LHLEGEGPVLIGRDDDRDRHTLLHLPGGSVEGLAEFHDVQTALTERGADRRRRIGRAGGNLELDEARYFLRHVLLPCTHTGVCMRPWCGAGMSAAYRHPASHGVSLFCTSEEVFRTSS